MQGELFSLHFDIFTLSDEPPPCVSRRLHRVGVHDARVALEVLHTGTILGSCFEDFGDFKVDSSAQLLCQHAQQEARRASKEVAVLTVGAWG